MINKYLDSEKDNKSLYVSSDVEIIDSQGDISSGDILLINEITLNIILGDEKSGTRLCSIACLPSMLEELIVGVLFGRRIINSYADIISVSIREEDEVTAYVILADNIHQTESVLRPESAHFYYKNETVFELASIFSKDTPVHLVTGAAHSCLLAHNDRLILSAEDIGRHNAIDKTIGYALINNIPLAECMVFTSARVSYEMVKNVINAGVPVLIGKSVPTKKAVDFAKEHNLTLLCRARDDCFYKFN